ncbi:ROK family transcriptional regulator [Devosia sp. 2618]|uniref:ROK family transcriptional regulator n=1 Tax=Devosia sp. 2618 TaxID=3156454 RepID=UPI003393F0CF
MRFAPPPAMRVDDRVGGLNQISVRSYNERLIMSLLRQHGQLSRMELGQRSGLSAQTISVIVRALERDELVVLGDAQRGRVGPPTTPLSLRADGAFSIGVKIGMKSTDLVLIDFLGQVQHRIGYIYDFPDSDLIFDRLATDLETLRSAIAPAHRSRLTGIGIAVPEGIENLDLTDMSDAAARRWAEVDFEARVGAIAGMDVHIQNDVTAAAGAEMIFGAARQLNDFAYFFVGGTTSCRLALGHRIYAGKRFINQTITSLSDLYADLAPTDRDAGNAIWRGDTTWPDFGPAQSAWIKRCATDLTDAITALSSFVDIRMVIIDGRVPRPIADALRDQVADHLTTHFADVTVQGGTIGSFSKAVGAAALCLHSRYMVENSLLSL